MEEAMTLHEFKAAPLSEQFDALSDHGVRLLSRPFAGLEAILYQIDDFYVEVLYDKSEGGFSISRAFITTLLLDPYLQTINIDGLLQSIE